MLVVGDLHLTDKRMDEYRWGLFEFLETAISEHNINKIIFLGDISDSKDRHSSRFVNRLVDNFRRLSKDTRIFILIGNHDYVDRNLPFIRFLDEENNIDVIYEPTEFTDFRSNHDALFLPHSNDIQEDGWYEVDFSCYHYIFMHQTVNGALASNGQELPGITQNIFGKDPGLILSGDIHVPQQLGKVIYVGAPYRIHYNDNFDSRILWIDNKDQIKELHFNCLRRHTVYITMPDELASLRDINAGDQVKVRLVLSKAEFVEFTNRRKQVLDVGRELGLVITSVECVKSEEEKRVDTIKPVEMKSIMSKEEIFKRYCKNNNITGLEFDVGKSLVDEYERELT